MAEDDLFESTEGGRRLIHRLFAGSVLGGICLIWVYRAGHVPASGGARWTWLGLLAADIWFGVYWVITQSVRWSPTRRTTFKQRLSLKHEEELPAVDVFVCTADPTIEPPALVVNTVLSVMALDYPPKKLSVYLSDDGGSDLTFYALLEAARFAHVWIPLCRNLKLEPRSPAAFFRRGDAATAEELLAVQKLYEEMEERIRGATQAGRVPEEIRGKHKGFSQWLPGMTSRDHPSIVQMMIDGRDPAATDADGHPLPTLVYMAREKRPQYHHNFKAGAMNCLMRVSSEISGGRIILNVDCDMYSGDSQSVRDALCFFMDEKGGDIAFVQFSQKFANITINDLYASSLTVISEVDFYGMDGVGGPLYTGSGCFHRRRSLMGEKYRGNGSREEWKTEKRRSFEERSVVDLEETARFLTACTYERNTQWGNEIGLKYGCPVEDVVTGLAIQSRGWKSVFFNPNPGAFFGVAPMTLSQTLLQHKRWAEGDFRIFFPPFSLYIFSRPLLHRMAYSIYFLWAPNSLPTLYYSLLPSLSFLARLPLFPKLGSLWFYPFAYVAAASVGYGFWESMKSRMTVKQWWNEKRMWLYKRTTAYLFAFVETLIQKLGFRNPTFVITAKTADDGVGERFQREEMEFGASSPPSLDFAILGSIAMINLFCLAAALGRMGKREGVLFLGDFFFQIVICGLLVAINGPVYGAMFFRKDGGRMPASVTAISMGAAAAAVCFALAT